MKTEKTHVFIPNKLPKIVGAFCRTSTDIIYISVTLFNIMSRVLLHNFCIFIALVASA